MAAELTATEHSVFRDDGRVYYYKVGHGDPLIFLHNIELGGYIWERVLSQFAEHFTCYNVDLPGQDHSDIPPRQYFVEDFTQAIVDVMDSAGIERTNVVGSHGGCLVALDLAATHPRRVKKMVMDGLPYWSKERGRVLWEKFWLPRMKDRTSYDIPAYPVGYWAEAAKENPDPDSQYSWKADEILLRSRRWITLSTDAITQYDAESVGPKVKAPTLLIYGEGDALRRGEEQAQQGIKGSIYKMVPGVREPHWEEPEEFVRLAMQFLR